MNYNEMLLNLTKTADSIKIPNSMNADEISLDKARKQKTEVVKEIARIRKQMKEEGLI